MRARRACRPIEIKKPTTSGRWYATARLYKRRDSSCLQAGDARACADLLPAGVRVARARACRLTETSLALDPLFDAVGIRDAFSDAFSAFCALASLAFFAAAALTAAMRA